MGAPRRRRFSMFPRGEPSGPRSRWVTQRRGPCEALGATAETSGGRPKVGRTQEQISHELAELRQVGDLIELEFSDLASEFASTNEYDLQGFDSAISWIKEICHMSGGAAADRVCAGHQLQRLSQSEDAVLEGRIGFAHFVLLARTAAAIGGGFW